MNQWLFDRCLKICTEHPERREIIFRDLKRLAVRLDDCNLQNQLAAKGIRLTMQALARELGL